MGAKVKEKVDRMSKKRNNPFAVCSVYVMRNNKFRGVIKEIRIPIHSNF